LRGMCPYSFLKPREEVQYPPATFAKDDFRVIAGEYPSLETDPGYNGHGGPPGKGRVLLPTPRFPPPL
jgi:hypothetical protein